MHYGYCDDFIVAYMQMVRILLVCTPLFFCLAAVISQLSAFLESGDFVYLRCSTLLNCSMHNTEFYRKHLQSRC